PAAALRDQPALEPLPLRRRSVARAQHAPARPLLGALLRGARDSRGGGRSPLQDHARPHDERGRVHRAPGRGVRPPPASRVVPPPRLGRRLHLLDHQFRRRPARRPADAGERVRDGVRAPGLRADAGGRAPRTAQRDAGVDPAPRPRVRAAHRGDPDRGARLLVGRDRAAAGGGGDLSPAERPSSLRPRMPILGWGTSARVRRTMSERGEIEREAVETIERASEGAGVQLDVKLGRGRAQRLQVSAAEKHTPWYREARGIVSALALFVSATSLAYTWRSDRAAELRQKRQELRQIVQELTEMRLRYVADLARMSDPQQQRDIGNILQAKQSILLEAAEVLADVVPREVTSSAFRTLAWENVYDARLAQAERLFRGALEASRTPTARAFAY